MRNPRPAQADRDEIGQPAPETIAGYEVHPAATIFPMLAGDGIQALATDIRTNGLLYPISRDPEGWVIDGRRRLVACEIAGVQPEFEEVDPEDPVAFVVSRNVKRRNLTAGQRAVAAAEAWDQVRKFPTDGGKRREVLAAMSDSNERYVQQARALVERAPDLADGVKRDVANIGDAYEELLERERQEKESRERKEQEERDRERLQRDYPDLFDRLAASEMTLAEAVRNAKSQDQERRGKAQKVTTLLAVGLVRLEHLGTVATWAEVAELYDVEIAKLAV